MLLETTAGEVFALPDAERERLLARLRQARGLARKRGSVLVGLTWSLAPDVDPSAVVLGSRRAGEPWFCMEHPDRDGTALATLGAVATLEDEGTERFQRTSEAWRKLMAGALADPPDGPPGTGLVGCGGFSFAPGRASTPQWHGFAPASLLVGEVSLARRGEDVRITVAALVRPDDDPEHMLARIEARLDELRCQPLGLLDPHPATRAVVAAAMAPEHYEGAVARGVERIVAGELDKIVLAREVDVHASQDHDVPATFGALREAFGACFVFAVGRGAATFIAASPELLIRREGLRASTLALAGSQRRSADPAVDDHLGERLMRSAKDREEHAIVVRRISRSLRPHAVWLASADEPTIARIANIQHLATPIRAQLTHPIGAIELAGVLHPTPAVGGEPRDVALKLIPALEGLDRGWYAAPVGWVDANEDGEFCVSLRCALIEGGLARLYAGVGVVEASDPASELAETEMKLAALLPLLAG